MTWRISVPQLEDGPEWLGVPEEGGAALELGAQLPGVTGGQGQPAGRLLQANYTPGVNKNT